MGKWNWELLELCLVGVLGKSEGNDCDFISGYSIVSNRMVFVLCNLYGNCVNRSVTFAYRLRSKSS